MTLGLITPGLGVETNDSGGMSHVGVVRSLKAERIPSHCGVVMPATVEGYKGTMMVEPSGGTLSSFGIDLEHMVVQTR